MLLLLYIKSYLIILKIPYSTKLWWEKTLVDLAIHYQSTKVLFAKKLWGLVSSILNGLCSKFSLLIFLQFQIHQSFVLYSTIHAIIYVCKYVTVHTYIHITVALALTPFLIQLTTGTDYYLKFLPRAVLLWNSLPPNLIGQSSLDDFRNLLNDRFWLYYLHNCIIFVIPCVQSSPLWCLHSNDYQA